ncbi:hypothetical protein DL765_001961 [Monosporascus sp. GIB2]|nr:hypothetical protein DL765_001961 [Monosporascus sp. GIB2]
MAKGNEIKDIYIAVMGVTGAEWDSAQWHHLSPSHLGPAHDGVCAAQSAHVQELCGSKAYQSVVLATTMWSKVDLAVGEKRERQLTERDDYWGAMYNKGSRVFRYLNNLNSAREIIDHILLLHKEVTLGIQDEIVNQGKDIEDTSAAVELNAEIIRERKKHQEELAAMKEQMQEAIEMRDREMQETFQLEIEELQSKIEKGVAEQRKLTESLEEVQKRKEAEFQAFKKQIQREQEKERQRYQRDLEQQRRQAKEQEENLKKEREEWQYRADMEKLRQNNEALEHAMAEEYRKKQQQMQESLDLSLRGALKEVGRVIVKKIRKFAMG